LKGGKKHAKTKKVQKDTTTRETKVLGRSEPHEHAIQQTISFGTCDSSRVVEGSSSNQLDERGDHKRTRATGKNHERARIRAQYTPEVLREMEANLTLYCSSLKLGLKSLLRRHKIRCVSIVEISSNERETRYRILGYVVESVPRQYIVVDLVERR